METLSLYKNLGNQLVTTKFEEETLAISGDDLKVIIEDMEFTKCELILIGGTKVIFKRCKFIDCVIDSKSKYGNHNEILEMISFWDCEIQNIKFKSGVIRSVELNELDIEFVHDCLAGLTDSVVHEIYISDLKHEESDTVLSIGGRHIKNRLWLDRMLLDKVILKDIIVTELDLNHVWCEELHLKILESGSQTSIRSMGCKIGEIISTGEDAKSFKPIYCTAIVELAPDRILPVSIEPLGLQ